MLTYLEHTPLRRFLGGSRFFQSQSASLLDARLFAVWGLALVTLSFLIWRLRHRLVRPQYSDRLWMFLIGLVFGGSALAYSLVSQPDTDVNFWKLEPYVLALPAPVYTDRYTAFDLGFLSGYHASNIRSIGYLNNDRLGPILHRHQGCILISEPQLDREHTYPLGEDGTSLVSATINRPPLGWRIVKQVAATENPLESIVILCAHT